MPTQLTNNFSLNAPKHLDSRYLKDETTPWASVTEVHSTILYKYIGLTVLIGTVEYWYKSAITLETDLIVKVAVVDLSGKVDKVTGKGLSTEDYTIPEKTKLGGIEDGATTNSPIQLTTTSGTSIIISNQTKDIWLIVDPSTTLATFSATLSAAPIDGQLVTMSFGGTINSGTVVTTISILPNTGQTILQASTPTAVNAGESISYRYSSSISKWYRIN